VPALRAIAGEGPERALDLPELAHLLFYSAGITKRLRGHDFRAASCTGALYHIDLYVVCGDIPGLEAGVYHFGVDDFSLRRLRAGDHRGEVARAAAEEPSIARAEAVVACASTYWRNAWKYRARTYRHAFWDTGTIVANALASAAAQGVPAKVVLGFEDSAVERLLGLHTGREATTALIALGRSEGARPSAPAVDRLDLPIEPVSQREYEYPVVQEMHAASSLANDEVAAWRGPPPARELPEPPAPLFPLEPLSPDEEAGDAIEDVIVRRGSTRRFALKPIAQRQLATILDRSTATLPADFLEGAPALNDLYLIVHAVEGLPQGAYVYRRERRALELLQEGRFREKAGVLGLEQVLPSTASADVFFLAHLPSILERYGNRGYRAAQLEAGIVGGKQYLAAYALGLGGTGLTFYDDDVTEFFSPHANEKSAIFLMALGVPARR
jgi:SagB-type dehydrogenase family enzyme